MIKELKIRVSQLEGKRFLTIDELVEILGTSQNTIYRICKKNEINRYKYRGRNWFKSEEVKGYLIRKRLITTLNGLFEFPVTEK